MIFKAITFNKRIYLMIIALFILVVALAGCSIRSLKIEQESAVGPTQMDPGLSPNLDKVMDNIHSVSSYKSRLFTERA